MFYSFSKTTLNTIKINNNIVFSLCYLVVQIVCVEAGIVRNCTAREIQHSAVLNPGRYIIILSECFCLNVYDTFL